ncbi:MAG: hypothetical protein K9L28_09340, partial [Synergistales bacterium]|nr:hypothetical protein [Synergistales bacterium]
MGVPSVTEPILSVDLAGGTVETEPLSSREYAFGGRGTNQELLAERMRPGVEPLDPASWIMLGTGAFTGSDIPASPRLAVDFRNVLNGGVGSANCGGFFGAALRNAGVAHLCITGAAEHPVYLEVDRGRVALRDARHLWGMTVSRTEEAIRSELGDSGARTLAIGPAGERMVRFACLIADRGRAAGYGGPGAVFGSKNLKAVAVRSGGGDGPGRIGEAAGAVARRLRESAFGRVHAEGGTLWAYLRNGS